MRVFISYTHRDRVAAQLCEHWLSESGFHPIRDETKFSAGRISEQIKQWIRDCDLFLVVLTCDYYKSRWASDELGQARAHNKPILFVAFDETKPQEPDSHILPLQLYRKDFTVWRSCLVMAAKEQLGLSTWVVNPSVDQWLTQNLGASAWVRKRVQMENIVDSRCYVGSVVELASNMSGWRRGKVFAFDTGIFEIEDEVREILGTRANDANIQERENYALRSLKENLTDEPWLELNLQRISHHLMRLVADSFDQIDKVSNPRRHLFETGSLVFPHSVVVHIALVTADNCLVLGHRSSRPRVYENCWTTTYEEHMKVSEDGVNPFTTAIRGLREELVGHDPRVRSSTCVSFFSVFRELDHWENVEKKEAFWVVNVGIAGMVRIPLTAKEVFANWTDAVDRREFRHLVAIPYTFDNVLALAIADSFDPRAFADDLVGPGGLDPSFPDLASNPHWMRQHPTNKIRLARCLTADFLTEVRNLAKH